MASTIDFRPLNVALRPHSRALEAYSARATVSPDAIAGGLQPHPSFDLTFRGGRTITDLVFVNQYLGGAGAWKDTDRQNIDSSLGDLLSDPGLQNMLAQYASHPLTSTMLPSGFVEGSVGDRFFKDDVEAMVAQRLADGVLGDTDPANTVICLMLPPGVVLVDGNSDGSDVEDPRAKFVLVDDEQADSTHGLGGYHGSVHLGAQTVYYAVGVYSEGDNGIVAFDAPWKNVVATFYHELIEARTDPDLEDVIRTGKEALLGWYSAKGGEIGDIPMQLAGGNLSLIMREVKLHDGTIRPMQLQWSNAVHGPEGPIATPH